ncbi:autotransporter outer membrane beta-barrel domain-containing protein [Pseudomonas muyukensis]|uniref:Autotransporter outer membrane beta-barrel domain-containing protein n=1 Tax=Pseudomonas muyukensis TaxID=2842357 RepID=A0ABX8MCN7_9PSED|nr:autotransporter outer membrane beta-barrel domain-containing protein [Pseudomonas muyukensis]QXH36830.1 autotransporter outer membrane beta-barrel domain-containing protein [Pseudomonas muyukensis]
MTLAVYSGHATARDLVGETLTIDASTPITFYNATANSTLNVNGAQTQALQMNQSTLNMTSGVVSVTSGNAIGLLDGTATIANANIVNTGNGMGLLLARGFGQSTASVSDSQISAGIGAQVTAGSQLLLRNTQVTGRVGPGLRLLGGATRVEGGSHITGQTAGVQMFAESTTNNAPQLTLDNSHVSGVAGPAIVIGQGTVATLDVLNGSSLTGGNGTALQVRQQGTANVRVDASTFNGGIDNAGTSTIGFSGSALNGDAVTSATGKLDLAFQDSTMTGSIKSAGITQANLVRSSLNGDIESTGTSTVTLNASTLNGNVTTAENGTLDLALVGSEMTGNIQSAGATQANFTRSSLKGDIDSSGTSTVTFADSTFNGNATTAQSGTLDLTLTDSAMTGNIQSAGTTHANFTRSSLTGNVDVGSTGAFDLLLAQGQMTGDVTVTQGGSASLDLQNGAQLLGALRNVNSATLGGGSHWTLNDDSNVGDLVMQGGQVTFGDPGRFHNLTVTNLSGDGTFVMANDFVTGAGDQLIVTGKAEGNHGLLVGSSGQEASVDSLRLVQIQTQPQPGEPSAHFYLLNDRERVDVGAYSYELAEDENGWVLNRETRTVAPITMTAMALFNTPITVAYGELSSLRSRMGELRYSEGRNAGLWMRAYGNQYNVSGASQGAGYQQNQRGMSLGADMQLADSDWLVGVLAGSSRSDLNLDYGSSGTVDSYYVGGYATWLDRETGFYVDTVLKYNRYQNNAKVGMSDHTRSKGDYDTHGVSASVEAGKHIKLNDGYFIEPFVQVATAAVAGKDYTFDNGLRAEGDMAKSLLGKVGTTVGKTIPLDGGAMVQPYVKGAFAHEFAQRNQVQVNNNVFNNDLSGSRAELGAGVSLALSKQFRAHFEIESSYGKHIEQPYGVNVGVRYDF